jgi:hypothetical protein
MGGQVWGVPAYWVPRPYLDAAREGADTDYRRDAGERDLVHLLRKIVLVGRDIVLAVIGALGLLHSEMRYRASRVDYRVL